MLRQPTNKKSLTKQLIKHSNKKIESTLEYEGGNRVVSTGSTLLDLAISGGRFKYGGVPSGIFVEIFGPNGCGKTVILCELAGAVQRGGGDIMFKDPEARLNTQFAKMFGLDIDVNDDTQYDTPDTIPAVFESVRKWEPTNPKKLNGIFADSLAALSTDLEMKSDDGDKMGMRRAKEFSEQLRKTCRVLTNKDILMACSNQIRQNADAGPYGTKVISPGGEAIGFYASLRLRCMAGKKLKNEKSIKGKKVNRVYGIKTEVEVFKSSVWKPYHTAPIYIVFDYGIDDIRGNLQFCKTYSGATGYFVNGEKMGQSMDDAVATVESAGLEQELKDQTVKLWNEIELKFEVTRKPKRKFYDQ